MWRLVDIVTCVVAKTDFFRTLSWPRKLASMEYYYLTMEVGTQSLIRVHFANILWNREAIRIVT